MLQRRQWLWIGGRGFTSEATWFAGYRWCYAWDGGSVGTGPSVVALIATRLA